MASSKTAMSFPQNPRYHRDMLRYLLIALILLAGLTPAQAQPLRLGVETAEVVIDPLSGLNQLELSLTPASQQDMATFTAANVGRTVNVTIDGKLITSPVIQTPIISTSLMLTGNFTAAELQVMADQLSAQDAVVELKLAKQKR